MAKNPPAVWGTWIPLLGWEDPLEKGTTTHSSILAGEFHGQRGLAGYSPWGRKDSDTTERLSIWPQREFLPLLVPKLKAKGAGTYHHGKTGLSGPAVVHKLDPTHVGYVPLRKGDTL